MWLTSVNVDLHGLSLADIYIIPYFFTFVKRFSKNICNYFSYTRPTSYSTDLFLNPTQASLCAQSLKVLYLPVHCFLSFWSCVPLLITIILYHTIGKMSSGNFAQTFSGKIARSVQNAQNGTRRPGSFRSSFRQKRKNPELSKSSGILLRGLSRGNSD